MSRLKDPPDITYNPTKRNIPYSTHSATAAKRIASSGGQKSYANHREADVKAGIMKALKKVMRRGK